MPWFKVDDGLAFHAKVMQAGNPAMGLWVRAGAWSAQHLTDGLIPFLIADTLGTKAQQARLVQVALWSRTSDGFLFHEWNEDGRQPTRERVLAERKANADRQKRHRERRDQAVSNGVTDGVTDGASHSTPSRPVPTRPTDFLRQSVEPPVENPGEDDGLTDEASHDGAESAKWAGFLGVNLEAVRTELGKHTGRDVAGPIALRICSEVLDRAGTKPARPTAYVLKAIRADWAEWQQFIDREEGTG
jgi:hypothetical protein